MQEMSAENLFSRSWQLLSRNWAPRTLIERVADPQDGRASLIQLGAQGGALLSELRQRSTEALRAAMGEMTAADRETISRAIPVLERLSELLSRVER